MAATAPQRVGTALARSLTPAAKKLVDALPRDVVDDIFGQALKRQQGVSMKYMLEFGAKPIEKQLILSAQFLHQELPVRLAHRVAELENLPFGLSTKRHVLKVAAARTCFFHLCVSRSKDTAPLRCQLCFRERFSILESLLQAWAVQHGHFTTLTVTSPAPGISEALAFCWFADAAKQFGLPRSEIGMWSHSGTCGSFQPSKIWRERKTLQSCFGIFTTDTGGLAAPPVSSWH